MIAAINGLAVDILSTALMRKIKLRFVNWLGAMDNGSFCRI